MWRFVKKFVKKMSGEILSPHSSGFYTKQLIHRGMEPEQSINCLPKINFDETDNNTHKDRTQTSSLKPRYVMDEKFHREDERIKTFTCFPAYWLSKEVLAMSGMFYLGDDDKTKCYFCEVEIGCWDPEDQPVLEHLRWSPNCPLLRRRTTNNVPINCEALDHLLPPISYDICGFNEHIEVRHNALPEGTMSDTDVPPNAAASTSGPSSSSASAATATNYYPEYPEYAIETARLRTFSEWPRNMQQKPHQLAEAGFFYTGVGDRVKCFSCGGGLKDWDQNDEPWEQHALWMGKCRYVQLVKGDNYIKTVVNRFKKSFEEKESENNAEATAVATASSSMTNNNNNNSAADLKEPAANQTVAENLNACSSSTATTPTPASAAGGAGAGGSSSIPEEKLCKICYANEYNTAFLPCGHVVACAKCASSVTKCPMCRKPFANVMRVYFS